MAASPRGSQQAARQRTTHCLVLALSMAKFDGSGSRLTTVALGHSSLNSMLEKPALAPANTQTSPASPLMTIQALEIAAFEA